MRLILSIYILTLTTFCYGQNLDLVKTETESYYTILIDSIDLNLNYTDGRYKAFLSDTNEFPTYVFNVIDGKVDGPYLNLTLGGWEYGNYSQDSLWTFLTAPDDTTFKIGTWKHHIYGAGAIGYIHKIPYDTDGNFTEIWQYYNGKIARKATFKKGFGLKKETYWDFETNEISKQTINNGNKNFYQSIVYKNDSLSYISLIQDSVSVTIDYNSDSYFCKDKPCMNIRLDYVTDDYKEESIMDIELNGHEKIPWFRNARNDLSIIELNGNLLIEYTNKKGKRKSKRIKLK